MTYGGPGDPVAGRYRVHGLSLVVDSSYQREALCLQCDVGIAYDKADDSTDCDKRAALWRAGCSLSFSDWNSPSVFPCRFLTHLLFYVIESFGSPRENYPAIRRIGKCRFEWCGYAHARRRTSGITISEISSS